MPDVHLVDGRDDVVCAAEVLLAGWDPAEGEALADGLRRRGIVARQVSALPGVDGGANVLALGPELSPADAVGLLRGVPKSWVLLAFAAGEGLDGFQELIDGDRLFFLTRRPPAVVETIEILVAAAKRAEPEEDEGDDDWADRLPELLRRLAQETDAASALRALADEARTAADAERVQVWLYDPDSDSLTDGARRESAAAGVTSYVARTGRGGAVEALGDDPRYDPALDHDGRDPAERFLAWPLAVETDVLAVVTLTRAPQAPPFGDAERRRIERMALLAAPLLAPLVQEARMAARNVAIPADAAQLFRGEALEQYHRGNTDEGHLLELEPAWMRRAYGVILALLAAALLLSAVLRVDREAAGGGVVRQGRLIAVVPARDRAELRAGLPLRFELSPRPLAVGSVSTRVVPSSEARKILGPDGAALWTSTDAAVRIEASLPRGEAAQYSDGVAGRVHVRLGRERVLFALIPALRGWSPHV